MIYSKTYQGRLGDSTHDGHLSLKSIIEILGDAGSSHSDSVGDNIVDSAGGDLIWVSVSWDVEIFRRPLIWDNLHVDTWAIYKGPAVAQVREFLVRDDEGNTIMQAAGTSALIDRVSGRPTRIMPERVAPYQPESRSLIGHKRFIMRDTGEYELNAQLPVRRADVDFNDHVHNSQYVDYAAELLDLEAPKIRHVRVLYKSSALYGENLRIKASLKEGKQTAAIYHPDGSLSCLVELSV